MCRLQSRENKAFVSVLDESDPSLSYCCIISKLYEAMLICPAILEVLRNCR